MDELDRMHRRLVQNIRAGFPDLLTRPFEVALLYQQLVPYRLNRRELALDSNDEYELTLLQMLAGVRGLLSGDPDMQAALRAELESPNPDLTSYRAYATCTVSLAPEALRALDAHPLVRAPSESGPAAVDRPAASMQAALAARATEEVAVSGARMRSLLDSPSQAAATERLGPAPATLDRHTHAGCRYCGGELPEGREVIFCPHCGQNLSIKQCPACSADRI
jgi:predicted RNA-binding Zn-ribbon protein involved in translation (DUF1610 family)